MFPPTSAPFDQTFLAGQALMQGLLGMAGARPDAGAGQLRAAFAANAPRVAELQAEYQRDLARLWTAMLARQRGEPWEPVISPDREDRRFAGAEWRESLYHDYLKQHYLLGARLVNGLVEAAELGPQAKQRLRFYARQFVDLLSPANFAATNPEVVKAALASEGRTLAQGLRNLIGDVEKQRISQTDEAAFAVGRNLATTPGAVVYQNEVIQLIQYAPATPTVRARPFVMVPPCINKFYIMDLARENSFVRYAVERGNTAFMVSWRNITPEVGHLSWDDYIRDGVLRAFEVATEITGADRLNVLGYCVGGTMLGAALALLAARGEHRIESATFFTALLDFSDVGDLAVFVDPAGVEAVERQLGSGGVKEGRDLATVFNIMRANDLVWSYVISNYLKGKQPEAFDILYWNADSTNLAGPWYAWYLRNTYLENNLRVPGKVRTCGVPVDLGRVRVPAYVLATREDHIVPWKGAYQTTQLLKGDARFVLGASGHIAGVINPASKNRRSYWTNPHVPESPDEWIDGATEQRGSWWGDWDAWIGRFAGGEVPAPGRLGSAKYAPIEDAPGRYVKLRVV
ncbi:MAG TPA: class I poly(R)-hydroxyalkanoic acid synthase [Burkholderiales bacterium]|nr:class I poly(R)-hydroxyalkanoic acid synthase [Burkholderiales bacterium]